jgi:hypothetical protein
MLISTFAFITKRSMQINQNPTNKRILGSKGDKQKHCGLRPRSRLQHGLITGAPSSFIIIITLTAHPTSNKEEQGKLLERGERESAEANYPRRKFKGGKKRGKFTTNARIVKLVFGLGSRRRRGGASAAAAGRGG